MDAVGSAHFPNLGLSRRESLRTPGSRLRRSSSATKERREALEAAQGWAWMGGAERVLVQLQHEVHDMETKCLDREAKIASNVETAAGFQTVEEEGASLLKKTFLLWSVAALDARLLVARKQIQTRVSSNANAHEKGPRELHDLADARSLALSSVFERWTVFVAIFKTRQFARFDEMRRCFGLANCCLSSHSLDEVEGGEWAPFDKSKHALQIESVRRLYHDAHLRSSPQRQQLERQLRARAHALKQLRGAKSTDYAFGRNESIALKQFSSKPPLESSPPPTTPYKSTPPPRRPRSAPQPRNAKPHAATPTSLSRNDTYRGLMTGAFEVHGRLERHRARSAGARRKPDDAPTRPFGAPARPESSNQHANRKTTSRANYPATCRGSAQAERAWFGNDGFSSRNLT